jgi:hypothetical protein
LSTAFRNVGRYACLLHSCHFVATVSMLPGTPLAIPQWDRKLVTAFRSPATIPALAGSIPGSKLRACYFASLPTASAVRSALQLRYPYPACDRTGTLHRFAPVTASAADSVRSA